MKRLTLLIAAAFAFGPSFSNAQSRPPTSSPFSIPAGLPLFSDSPSAAPTKARPSHPLYDSQPNDSNHAGANGTPSYTLRDLPSGTIAIFDGWKTQEVLNENNTYIFDTYAEGRQKDFVLRVVISTPGAQDLQNFFTLAPQITGQFLQQLSPNFRQSAAGQRTKSGGDDALVEEYSAEINGSTVRVRALYVRRGDVGIIVFGFGTDRGFSDFARTIDVTAESIKLKESQLEAGLIGTWVCESSSRTDAGGHGVLNVSSSRTITFRPNGTFTDSAVTTAVHDDGTGLATDGSAGKVIRRGNTLTFHYANGQTWTAAYTLYSNGLKLNGQIYLKQ